MVSTKKIDGHFNDTTICYWLPAVFQLFSFLCLEVHRTSFQLWLKAHRHVGHQLDSEKPQITIKKRKLNVNTFFQKQVLHLAFDRNKKTHRRK